MRWDVALVNKEIRDLFLVTQSTFRQFFLVTGILVILVILLQDLCHAVQLFGLVGFPHNQEVDA